MKLTPLDIRKHEFPRRFRGYDPEEVRPFLEMLSQQWDELKEELRHAKDRVREAEIKLEHYERVEEALQEALQSARLNAQRTEAHAEERARLVIEEAELRSEQIIRDAEQERFRLRQDVSKLSHRHAEVTARLRHFLMSELEVLAQHEDERPIGFMKLIPSREAEALPASARKAEAPERSVGDAAGSGHGMDVRSPEPTPPKTEETPSTTYADLYARAAERTRPADEQDSGEGESLEDLDTAEEEPTWTLRSIVSDEDERGSDLRSAERDQIRRIIEDLD
jgi:cell division initiation protein